MKIFNLTSEKFRRSIYDIFFVWMEELKIIFKDPGVRLLFIIAPIAYPILYGVIYQKEAVHEVPIAVVDNSASDWSRKYIRALDATPDVAVAEKCISMDEAIHLYQHRKVHGIVLIPSDFNTNIVAGEQARVSVYNDMSSFLYYKALMSASSFVSRDLGQEIQLDNLMAKGLSYEQASTTAEPFTYSYNPVYTASGGYASFLLPMIFILIIFQTLVLGIGMRSGTDFERDPTIYLNRTNGRSQSVFGMIMGKSLCYTFLYGILSFYILVLVPRWFNLPHDGGIFTIFMFLVPFLLSTVFFAMTISTFLYNRENSMVLFLFSSVILLFISGVPWPSDAIPWFWKAIGWLLPSTHGIQGYVRINTMGAPLSAVSFEYLSLWILTGVYFITAYSARLIQLHRIKRTTGVPTFTRTKS